ncbi:hypothetical protein ACFL1B_04155 [Nanoarchaeota archaeon]
MKVVFSMEEGDFPYRADYEGFQTAPVAPAFGLGGKVGYTRGTFDELLDGVFSDLANYSGSRIEAEFSDEFHPDTRAATSLALYILQERNTLEAKIANARAELDK